MKGVYRIAKVDYFSKGRKINLAELTWELRDDGFFTAQGGFWNSKGSDYIRCGQCVDAVAEFFPDSPLITEMLDVWSKWHLKVVTDESVLKKIRAWWTRVDHSLNDYTEFQDYIRQNFDKESLQGIKLEKTYKGYGLLSYPKSSLVSSVIVPLPIEKTSARRAIERMQQLADYFEKYGDTEDDDY